jgi:hypothetical protein
MDRRCTLELGVVAAICKHTYQKIFRGDYIISTIHNNKSLEHGVVAAPNMLHLVPSLGSVAKIPSMASTSLLSISFVIFFQHTL